MKILLDPGHGGQDSGAVGPSGLTEKAVVLDIAKMVGFGLEHRQEIHYTRDTDGTMALHERCWVANNLPADLFVSIHANAAANPQAHGFEVYTSPGYTAADPIATTIFNTVRQAFPDLRGRIDSSDGDPDKENRFYVLVHTDMPAVLIETAFISNPEEERWLADRGWRMRMAGAIVSALWRL